MSAAAPPPGYSRPVLQKSSSSSSIAVPNPLAFLAQDPVSSSSRSLLALRRPSGGSESQGFTTFTAGISLGWNSEFNSRRFRQAVFAEFNGTMILVAVGVASVVFTHDAVDSVNSSISGGGGGGNTSALTARGVPLLAGAAAYAGGIFGGGARLNSLARYSQTSPPFGIKYGAMGLPYLDAGALQTLTNGTAADQLTDAAISISYSAARQLNIAFCFGLMVGVLVFSTGSISGGNLNPAVTISLALTQKMSTFRATCYVVAQCVGAVCGAGIIRLLSDKLYVDSGGGANVVTVDPSTDIGLWTAVGGEILGTALLVFTVCAAADVGREKNNKYQGALTPLIIGFAVLVAHLFLLPIDGCSINPARTFGTAVMMDNFNNHPLFWGCPLLGGAAAALLYENLFRLYPTSLPPPSGSSSSSGGGGGSGSAAGSSGSSGSVSAKGLSETAAAAAAAAAASELAAAARASAVTIATLSAGAPPALAGAAYASQAVALDVTGKPLTQLLGGASGGGLGSTAMASVAHAATAPGEAPSLAAHSRHLRVQAALNPLRGIGMSGEGSMDLGGAYAAQGAAAGGSEWR